MTLIWRLFELQFSGKLLFIVPGKIINYKTISKNMINLGILLEDHVSEMDSKMRDRISKHVRGLL